MPDTSAPVRWRHFDPGTFEIGRDLIDIGGGRSIGIYSAERSIIDAFRMRHLEGADLATSRLGRTPGMSAHVLISVMADA